MIMPFEKPTAPWLAAATKLTAEPTLLTFAVGPNTRLVCSFVAPDFSTAGVRLIEDQDELWAAMKDGTNKTWYRVDKKFIDEKLRYYAQVANFVTEARNEMDNSLAERNQQL